MFTASFLTDVKKKAIRGRVWFRALDSLERGILSLSAKILDVVQSTSLSLELAKIVEKIEDSLLGVFERKLLRFGLARVNEIVVHAVKLGCFAALSWDTDHGFARYLTFLCLNTPSYHSISNSKN